VLLGILMVVVGLAAELGEGSFRHWFDWGWPKRNDPKGEFWIRVLGGRIFVVLGLVVIVTAFIR
jgi:hypothetical protein